MQPHRLILFLLSNVHQISFSLCLFNPLLDEFLLQIDKYEALFLLDTLSIIRAIDLEVGNRLHYLFVVLPKSDLHHVGKLTVCKLRVATAEHLVCWKLAQINASNLFEWNHNVWLIWQAPPHRLVFVHEEGMLVQNDIPLDYLVVLVQELANWSF